jgi:DNA repair protein RadC
MKEIFRRTLIAPVIRDENILSSWDSLVEYLKVHMGNNQIEQFRVLFLNKKNLLIADEIQTHGTIDQTAIYPREIIRKCLFHGASAIILVHNHPSGNPNPSKADIELTKVIANVCAPFNIAVHDHVIVGGNKIFSFKSNFLL